MWTLLGVCRPQGSFWEKISLCKGLFFTQSPYARVCFSHNLPTQGSVFGNPGRKSEKWSLNLLKITKSSIFDRFFSKIALCKGLFSTKSPYARVWFSEGGRHTPTKNEGSAPPGVPHNVQPALTLTCTPVLIVCNRANKFSVSHWITTMWNVSPVDVSFFCNAIGNIQGKTYTRFKQDTKTTIIQSLAFQLNYG